METFFLYAFWGVSKVFRYHAVPPCMYPPLIPQIAVESKGESEPGRSSMLQSCGKSMFLHVESLKNIWRASSTSPEWNFQSKSKSNSVRGFSCIGIKLHPVIRKIIINKTVPVIFSCINKLLSGLHSFDCLNQFFVVIYI